MKAKELTKEDKIALAEAYRFYQMLIYDDQQKIPQDFIEFLKNNGDLDSVKPFESKEDALNAKLSQKANYLIMYMCTFNN